MLSFSLFFVSFCFFKQKTAYEMRISDWSSDVCSSDLLAVQRTQHIGTGDAADQAGNEQAEEERPFDVAVDQVADPRHAGREHLDDMDTCRGGRRRHAHPRDEQRVADVPESHADRAVAEQIGRAACRDRVCPYVRISVVAVSSKTKTHNPITYRPQPHT